MSLSTALPYTVGNCLPDPPVTYAQALCLTDWCLYTSLLHPVSNYCSIEGERKERCGDSSLWSFSIFPFLPAFKYFSSLIVSQSHTAPNHDTGVWTGELVIKFPYETVKENIYILLFQVGCRNIFALDFLWFDLGETVTTVNTVPFG